MDNATLDLISFVRCEEPRVYLLRNLQNILFIIKKIDIHPMNEKGVFSPAVMPSGVIRIL